MQYKIKLNVSGREREEKGNLPLEEIMEFGDRMIERAIRESE